MLLAQPILRLEKRPVRQLCMGLGNYFLSSYKILRKECYDATTV